MNNNIKVKKMSELTGWEREVSDLSTECFKAVRAAFYDHMRKFPPDTIKKLDDKGFAAFVYNVAGLFSFDTIAQLNNSNNISLEDALANLDGLSTTIKTMMTNNWGAIQRERDESATNCN